MDPWPAYPQLCQSVITRSRHGEVHLCSRHIRTPVNSRANGRNPAGSSCPFQPPLPLYANARTAVHISAGLPRRLRRHPLHRWVTRIGEVMQAGGGETEDEDNRSIRYDFESLVIDAPPSNGSSYPYRGSGPSALSATNPLSRGDREFWPWIRIPTNRSGRMALSQR